MLASALLAVALFHTHHKQAQTQLVIPTPSAQCPRTETLLPDYHIKGKGCRAVSDSLALCDIDRATLQVRFVCVKVKQPEKPKE